MSVTTAMRTSANATLRRVKHARLRLPATLIAAAVVAQGAVFLLRPRERLIDPAPLAAGDYFTRSQIDHAHDFRGPQIWLYAGSLAIELGVLVLLVRRPPARLRAGFRRPVLAGAAAAAALSVALTAATLPLAAISRQRALDVGLVTQGWPGWAGDTAKSALIGAAMAAAGGAALLGLMRKVPRHWWAPGSAVVVLAAVAFTYAGPVVLDPVFNRFTPLPAGKARSDVLDLARLADVKVGEVYEVDASRRTTAANAYVTGLGKTKRVVLYDTLLKNFSRDELRLVVAHELGHVRHRDVPRGLLYLLLVAPFGLLAVQRLTERMAPGASGTPAVLPAAALSVALMATGVTTISNQLSRRVERRADQFSLKLTHAPAPFISFERGIALRNVADPDPPGWQVALLGTHPPVLDRIGMAVAYERSRAAGR